MITFLEFLDEAKKSKSEKEDKRKPVLSKKKIKKILDAQGGIGGKAVKDYVEKNPDRGVIRYTLK